MSLDQYKESFLPAIETELKRTVELVNRKELSGLFQMLSYHFGWVDEHQNEQARGKRIRPLLLLLITEAAGGKWEDALPAAAAIELVHNFSLIHDDIQDESPIRRGRMTVWKKWNVPQAINAGDAMFALAHIALQGLVETTNPDIMPTVSKILPTTCLTLTQGQYLDLAYTEDPTTSMEAYWVMIEGKTATLLAASTELGAIVAGVKKETQFKYREFGRYLGLAFQVWDDYLGIWGEPKITGKSSMSDLLTGKKSLPILYGLEQSEEVRGLLAQETLTPADVHHAAELLQDAGTREYVEQLAQEHHAQALAALEEVNLQGPAAEALHELAQKLLNREK